MSNSSWANGFSRRSRPAIIISTKRKRMEGRPPMIRSRAIPSAIGVSRSLKQGDTEVFGETVLRMQQPSGGAPPCGGSADQPNYAGGFVFAHALSGSGLPSQDQNTWSCFSYDGAGRLVESALYPADGDAWNGTISYAYGYDPNGNLTGIETGVPSAKAQGAMLEPKLGTRFAGEAFPLQVLKAAAAEGTSTSYSRSGADQLTSAKLASGSDLTLSYDSSNIYGDVG